MGSGAYKIILVQSKTKTAACHIVCAPVLSLQADTARVIWSWGETDPASETGLTQHIRQGGTVINLLGGLNEDAQQADNVFEIRNSNVSMAVPSVEQAQGKRTPR